MSVSALSVEPRWEARGELDKRDSVPRGAIKEKRKEEVEGGGSGTLSKDSIFFCVLNDL